MTMLPQGAPNLDEILVQSESMLGRKSSLKGIHEKMLWRNDQTGASIALIKFERAPAFRSRIITRQISSCLPEGEVRIHRDQSSADSGCFYCNPKGNVHGPAIAHEETIVLEIYDGPHYPEKPSWYTDERDAH